MVVTFHIDSLFVCVSLVYSFSKDLKVFFVCSIRLKELLTYSSVSHPIWVQFVCKSEDAQILLDNYHTVDIFTEALRQ